MYDGTRLTFFSEAQTQGRVMVAAQLVSRPVRVRQRKQQRD
jgi:hypothetical protein